jgi:hypothetical protein
MQKSSKTSIVNFFRQIWSRLFPSKIDQINQKLEKAAREIEVDRMVLKQQIIDFVYLHYNVKSNSSFIPQKGVNRVKLYRSIHNKIGDQMHEVSLVLSKQLKWNV